MAKRRCSHCKKYYDSMHEGSVTSSVMFFCSPEHQFEYGKKNAAKLAEKSKQNRLKNERKKIRSKKATYNIDKRLETVCNELVRLRDSNLPCISCGTMNAIRWDAGHYRSKGGNPELRWDLRNINKQCDRCNCHGSANINGGKGWGDGYNMGIVNRFGVERLGWLNSYQPPKNYTLDDKKRLLKYFNYRVRQLKRVYVNN